MQEMNDLDDPSGHVI